MGKCLSIPVLKPELTARNLASLLSPPGSISLLLLLLCPYTPVISEYFFLFFFDKLMARGARWPQHEEGESSPVL
jgi:hypothetical protein